MLISSFSTGLRADTLGSTGVVSSNVSTRINRSDIWYIFFKPSARLSCGDGYRHCLVHDYLIVSERRMGVSFQVLTMQFLHGVPPSPIPSVRMTQQSKQPKPIHFTLRERQLVHANGHLILLPWIQDVVPKVDCNHAQTRGGKVVLRTFSSALRT